VFLNVSSILTYSAVTKVSISASMRPLGSAWLLATPIVDAFVAQVADLGSLGIPSNH